MERLAEDAKAGGRSVDEGRHAFEEPARAVPVSRSISHARAPLAQTSGPTTRLPSSADPRTDNNMHRCSLTALISLSSNLGS